MDTRRSRKPLKVVSDYQPSGDQPAAIAELASRINAGETDVVLLGATGTGKSATTAWLIEQAGFSRGWSIRPDAPASLSHKHTLAITNRGQASADDVVAVARSVRDGVEARFGISLHPEPSLIGCSI